MLQFFGRFINSFKELKAVELKKSIVNVLNNEEEFEEFIKNQCFIEKGSIKTKMYFEPFSFLTHG